MGHTRSESRSQEDLLVLCGEIPASCGRYAAHKFRWRDLGSAIWNYLSLRAGGAGQSPPLPHDPGADGLTCGSDHYRWWHGWRWRFHASWRIALPGVLFFACIGCQNWQKTYSDARRMVDRHESIPALELVNRGLAATA